MLVHVGISEVSVSHDSSTRYITITCDSNHRHGYCSSPSESLEHIASTQTVNQSSVYIRVNVCQLNLNMSVNFSRLSELNIDGELDLNTKIVCTSNTGLMFHDIANVVLTNLMIEGCGAAIKASQRHTYISAIIVLYGRDMSLTNVTVTNSTGIGLMLHKLKGGVVQIKSSRFQRNTLQDHRNGPLVLGGGGVHIGDLSPSCPITIKFDSCLFKENVARTNYHNQLYTNDLGQPAGRYGLGGGVAILLDKRLTDIHIIFTGCTFTKNEAVKGAGLFASIGGVNMRNVLVRVENCVFEENVCSMSNPIASGGGMAISFSDASNDFTSNMYSISNVTFKNNCAQYGGGLHFFSHHRRINDQSNKVEIDSCTFEGNKAHMGSAIDISPNIFDRLSDGVLVTPLFRNCIFSNNMVVVNTNENHMQATYGIGTLFVSLYSIKFEDYNKFENNLGTAIHIVNGNIDMSQSSVSFCNNTAVHGGAVSLIGLSSVIVGPDRNYEFVKNRAYEKGGAMYILAIDSHDFTSSRTCFIRYITNVPIKEWNSTIRFVGNKATSGRGDAIFATSLYACQVVNNGTTLDPQYELVNVRDVFDVRGIVIKDNSLCTNNCHAVATEAALLRYDDHRPVKNLVIVPGENVDHGVTFVDDLGNEAPVTLIKVSRQTSKVFPDTTQSVCFGTHIIIDGEENARDMVYLQSTTSRPTLVQLNVSLLECPPGLKFNDTTFKCICDHEGYVGLAKCNDSTLVSYINPGYWIGLAEDSRNKSRTELMTSHCLSFFCNYNHSYKQGEAIKLPKVKSKLHESLCGRARTGIACGSCAPGYTTYFHSPTFQCRPVKLCHLGWLFYILSELIPVTLVFVLVIAFNINFTSGALNGFIFFSQLLYSFNIDASGMILFPPIIDGFITAYRLLYGPFSLDFFQAENLSFCLFPNASALDMLAFKYITIAYALILMVLVIWFMNKCGGRCLGKWCRITTMKASVIHGISTFLILCYSQCIRISLNLLDNFSLHTKRGSDINVSWRVWLNGDMVYFSRKHMLYALPAFVSLLTIGIVPPILLLAYPLCNRLLAFFSIEDSKIVNYLSEKVRISSLKPLLDTFQGSFKDNLRFFAGLYFIYRWIAQTISVAPSTGFSQYDLYTNCVLTVILALHSLCQPYAQRAHNIIDSLLLADLTLITAISFFHLYVVRTKVGRETVVDNITGSAVLQLALMYLPLVVMLGYVVLLVYKHRRKCGRGYQMSSDGSTRTFSRMMMKLVDPVRSKEESVYMDELPHRMIANDVDYEQF